MNEPLVSIITPCHNCSKFIKETIDSIRSQTYQNWELLITDDCSTDDSREAILSYQKDSRIKYFRLSKNSGPGVARNNSISNASGRYIAFCDSDDKWLPDKLKKQVQFMLANDYALTFTSYNEIDEKGNYLNTVKVKDRVNYHTMLKNNYIGCLTAVYDTKKVGKMYMPEIRKRQDWALWLSILKKEDWAYGIKEIMAIYRDRSRSISSSKIEMLKYNWEIYHSIEKFSKVKSSLLLIQFLFYYFIKKLNK